MHALDTHPSTVPHPKRAAVACDYCRAKRLKCTADERPCMNCRLYGAECANTKQPRLPRSSTSKLKNRKKTLDNTRSSSRGITTPASTLVPDLTSIAQERETSNMTFDLGTPRTIIRLDPQISLSHDRYENAQQQFESTEFSMNELSEVVLPNDDLASYSDPINFTNTPFDFWDPSMSLHDGVFLGGVLDTGPDAYSSSTNMSLFLHSSMDPTNLPAAQLSEQRKEGWSTLPADTPRDRGGKVSRIHRLEQSSNNGPQQARILPGLFIRKDAANSNFIGLQAVGSTLAFCLKESLENTSHQFKNNAFDFLIEAGGREDATGILPSIDISQYELPQKEVARTSIEAYFKNVHCIYPVVDAGAFYSCWEQVYVPASAERSVSNCITLLFITAIGAICNGKGMPGQLDRLSNDLYHQVWQIQNDSFAKPSIDTVQILLLHVIFLLYHGRGGMAWILCGFAVRVAQAMGLHRQSPPDFDLTEAQIRLRSQLWWVAFGLDASLSVAHGRPTAASNSSHDIAPLPLDLEYVDIPELHRGAARLYRWKCELASIQNLFCDVLNRHEPVASRVDALAHIDEALTRWRDFIPLECRPEHAILVPPEVYPLIALLHLEYHDFLRALHWACITSVPANDNAIERHPNPRIRAGEMICLLASRSLIRTLNDLTDLSPSTNMFAIILHSDRCIAALAILYRNIMKNAMRMSAKTDLEYFRAGRLHLQRHFRGYARNSAMENVFDEMLRSAEKKVHLTENVSEVMT